MFMLRNHTWLRRTSSALLAFAFAFYHVSVLFIARLAEAWCDREDASRLSRFSLPTTISSIPQLSRAFGFKTSTPLQTV